MIRIGALRRRLRPRVPSRQSHVRGTTWLGLFLLAAVILGCPAQARAAEDGGRRADLPGAKLRPARALGDTVAPRLLHWASLDSLSDGSSQVLHDGDSLRVVTRWSEPLAAIEADVSAFRAPGPATVHIVDLGGNQYRLSHWLGRVDTPRDGKDLELVLRVRDGGGNADTVSLAPGFCWNDHEPEWISSALLDSVPGYRAGQVVRIQTRWRLRDAPGARVVGDFRRLQTNATTAFVAGQLISSTKDDDGWVEEFEIHYTIPRILTERGADGTHLPIPITCFDADCGTATEQHLELSLDTVAPALLRWVPLDSLSNGQPRPLRSGDTVRLETFWSEALDTFEVNFSQFGPHGTETTTIEKLSGTRYRVSHPLHFRTDTPDAADLRAVVVGRDSVGNGDTLALSPGFCVNNHDPVWLSTELVDANPEGFRGGQEIVIHTRWRLRDAAGSVAAADFRSLQIDTTSAFVVGSLRSSVEDSLGWIEEFEIRYRVPVAPEDRRADGRNLVIPIECADLDCGLTVQRNLAVNLDTSAPADRPVLDPLPAETTADSLLVRGQIFGETARVAVLRNDIVLFKVSADTLAHRFETWVVLEPDASNKITVWGEDPVGNRTPASAAQHVFQVRANALEMADPFVADETLRLLDPAGLSAMSIRIYDLEGRCLRSFRDDGPRLEYSVVWDGRDDGGTRAGQGPYIVHAQWRSGGRREREVKRPFLLKDTSK